jgi:histidine phosphotransferase ChpT
MGELEFAALLGSRVCHDLVSPVGAVVNGLEVLEDERDATMRADALKLVTSSAEQATARLQFARIAFGAAGSAGAELDLNEVGRTIQGLVKGGKVKVDWQAGSLNWPKDWAKLLRPTASRAADTSRSKHRRILQRRDSRCAPPDRTHAFSTRWKRLHAENPSIRSTAAASRPF